MTAAATKSPPSFPTAGPCWRTKGSAGRYATQRYRNDGARNRALRDDLGGDPADAGAGQADRPRCARRQIEDTPPDEGTTIIDRDDDTLAAMGHPELGAERQRAVGRGHGALVEALTGRSPAA